MRRVGTGCVRCMPGYPDRALIHSRMSHRESRDQGRYLLAAGTMAGLSMSPGQSTVCVREGSTCHRSGALGGACGLRRPPIHRAETALLQGFSFVSISSVLRPKTRVRTGLNVGIRAGPSSVFGTGMGLIRTGRNREICFTVRIGHNIERIWQDWASMDWGVVVAEPQRHRVATESLISAGIDYFMPMKEQLTVKGDRHER